jgi:hypothetical protein
MEKLKTRDSKSGCFKNSKKGMELVQVAILIGIAVFLGLIFKTQIGDFINSIFGNLMGAGF